MACPTHLPQGAWAPPPGEGVPLSQGLDLSALMQDVPHRLPQPCPWTQNKKAVRGLVRNACLPAPRATVGRPRVYGLLTLGNLFVAYSFLLIYSCSDCLHSQPSQSDPNQMRNVETIEAPRSHQ